MSAYVEIEISYSDDGPEGPTAERFEAFLDRVMEQLDAIDVEADLTAALAAFTASFVIPTTERSDDEFLRAIADLRTALSAVDCDTSGWPNGRHEILAARSVAADELVSA